MASDLNIRTIDDKGRITLGRQFAGVSVAIEEAESGITLKYVESVPVGEAWLLKNLKALEAVRVGVEQAAAGNLVDEPEGFVDSLAFANSIED